MRRAFRRFVSIRLALALLGGLAMVVGGNGLLRLWLGRADVAFDGRLWGAMALLVVASTWVSAHAELLTMLDRLWAQVGLVFANGAATLALTWWLAPTQRVFGAVLATSAVTALLLSWVVPAIARPLLRGATAARTPSR